MVTHDLRKLLLGLLFLVFTILGIAACLACMKYGLDNAGVYLVIGVFGIVDVVYASLSFFKKYLND